MGLPGDGARLELTYNHGVDPYELGTGYNHIALSVDDMTGRSSGSPKRASSPRSRRTPVREGGSRLCFVQIPDGYRIELIERRSDESEVRRLHDRFCGGFAARDAQAVLETVVNRPMWPS